MCSKLRKAFWRKRNSSPLIARRSYSCEQRATSQEARKKNRLRGLAMQPTGVLENAKATNPLKDLLKFGQSVWLDYIRRDLITTGELKRMIEEDGLRGMTSNPAIFEKAISGGKFYDDYLKTLESNKALDAKLRFESLAIRDIQDAADVLRPVYEDSRFHDGYVSLEVSPYLARDTEGTLSEARR